MGQGLALECQVSAPTELWDGGGGGGWTLSTLTIPAAMLRLVSGVREKCMCGVNKSDSFGVQERRHHGILLRGEDVKR